MLSFWETGGDVKRQEWPSKSVTKQPTQVTKGSQCIHLDGGAQMPFPQKAVYACTFPGLTRLQKHPHAPPPYPSAKSIFSLCLSEDLTQAPPFLAGMLSNASSPTQEEMLHLQISASWQRQHTSSSSPRKTEGPQSGTSGASPGHLSIGPGRTVLCPWIGALQSPWPSSSGGG
jgi:hypothetical protein